MTTQVQIAAALETALKTLGPKANGGTGMFVTVKSEVVQLSTLKGKQQPCCILWEMDVDFDWGNNPAKRSSDFWIICGVQTGPDKTGASVLNPIADAFEELFPLDQERWNTLGDLVVGVCIKHMRKDIGDHVDGPVRQHVLGIQLEVISLAM